MHPRPKLLSGITAAALALAACGASLPEAPTVPDPAFVPMARKPAPGMTEDAVPPFTLLPGDVLSLRLTSAEEIVVDRLAVDTSGQLEVPLVGGVAVAGLTLGEASVAVEQAYQRYDRYARVVVRLVEPDGHRAVVTGTVRSPGSFVLAREVRVAELLALSGGPVSVTTGEGEEVAIADLGAGQLVRDGKPLPLDLQRALAGDPLHNVRVRARDVLYVPSADAARISVIGEVGRPRAVPFRSGMRLTQALAMAGGPTERADDGDVRIVRGSLSAPRVYTARLDELFDGEGHDVELAPGDVVLVTEHWLAAGGDVLARVTPALAAVAIAAALSQ